MPRIVDADCRESGMSCGGVTGVLGSLDQAKYASVVVSQSTKL